MNPLDLVRLTPLLGGNRGRPDVKIGLIDGPVDTNHPELTGHGLREITGTARGSCIRASSSACLHGTFVAGILCAKPGSPAPAICPGCTVLVRPVFSETGLDSRYLPTATPEELSAAIMECVDAGVRAINLSLALAQPSLKGEHALEEALDYAARRGVVIVVAAGNEGTVGSSAITRHSWVIPVVAYDLQGRPMNHSNLGGSLGKRGLGAPGDRITSLGTEAAAPGSVGGKGRPLTLSGTSVAAPFVTGAIALLLSEFPNATATDVRIAVTQACFSRRRMIVPPLLDAWGAYRFLAGGDMRRRIA